FSPSTRMSRTTKGSPCCAATGSAPRPRTTTMRTAVPARKNCFTRTSATGQPDDIVEKGEAHQEQQQQDADLLADDLHPLGYRAAFRDLNELVDDLPAVQQGNRQQVDDAQADTDDRQEAQEGDH